MKPFRFVLPFLFVANAQANIFYSDDREPAGGSLAAVGQLTHHVDGSQGTAFLVSRCHVLTNFHVAFANEDQPSSAERLTFKAPGAEPVEAIPVVWGATTPIDQDWALLKLDRCLGSQLGWLPLVTVPFKQAVSLAVKMAGFPNDRLADEATLDPSCRFHPEKPQRKGWRHDCATRSGNSGGPIFVAGAPPQVIAIAATAAGGFAETIRSYDVHLSNGAVPVSAFLGKISAILRRDSENFVSSYLVGSKP